MNARDICVRGGRARGYLLGLESGKQLVLDFNGTRRVVTARAALEELRAMGIPGCDASMAAMTTLPRTPENLRDVMFIEAILAHEAQRVWWRRDSRVPWPVWAAGGVGVGALVALVAQVAWAYRY